jgi:chromate transporter
MQQTQTKISFGEALRFWIKLGFISFGGPAGQIAIMQKELVDNKKWIDQDDFLHALNFCMLLPGPEAQQLATYIGWRMHGIRGGIAAGAFFVIPSIFFLLVLSYIYAAFGNLPQVSAVLDGFKAVVVAIVVEAILKIAKKAFKGYRHIVIAFLSFVAIYFLQVPFPLIVFGAALLGIFLLKSNNKTADAEENFKPAPVRKSRILKILLVCFGLWLVPFLTVLAAFGAENIALKTYIFFSQAAFVTFGGAYAVLAYVNQAVVSAGWITSAQAVDGLALAETTPGPLIMVLQFIGFMTGWNNHANFQQTSFAVLCALLTTFATFLPSFFFIFVGAPYIENLRHNRNLTSALSGVTASVVGVILNLALMFGATVIFPENQTNYFGLLLAVLSLIALYFFKADVLLVVIAGGILGFLKFLVIG